MCGISGLFDTVGLRNFTYSTAERINNIQSHRGPDDAGIHLEPGLALGHRRLSVIDIENGKQPLFNEEKTIGIVFNGEIYNYKILITQLKNLGYQFKTRTDTEVIVHAWHAWGKDCIKKLRGMFAFALWDKKQETLFLVRDRMGVKPLHYGWLDDDIFIFGSELKVLTAHPKFDRVIDPLAVEEYFAFGYVPDPRCIYKNAYKLEPGHMLVLSRGASSSKINSQKYWDVQFTNDSSINLEEAKDQLLEKVSESVKLRMVADVPLGAFLSGGIDSSAVVAAMAINSQKAVTTCAIGFDDPQFNESDYAQLVAEKYKTDHHLEIVGSEDFDLLDKLSWLYDEPFADSSAIPTYRVCQMARKHVTVALSGDGGDESLGGYRRYQMHLGEEQFRKHIPHSLRRPIFGTLGYLYPKADWAPQFLRAKTTFQAMANDNVEAYCQSMSRLRTKNRENLFSSQFKNELNGYHALEVFKYHAAQSNTEDPLALIQYLDYKTWMAGDINTKVDRASMAHSLEVREPLMDHELVEWLATLPSNFKIKNGQGKYIFKKSFEDLLPHDILYRKKMGFSVPLAKWLRGPLAKRTNDSVLSPLMLESGYFNPDSLKTMVKQHMQGLHDHSTPLWMLIVFEAFLRRSLDNSVQEVYNFKSS